MTNRQTGDSPIPLEKAERDARANGAGTGAAARFVMSFPTTRRICSQSGCRAPFSGTSETHTASVPEADRRSATAAKATNCYN